MFCDALCQEEILEAYLIYSSLHGWDSDPEQVRDKVTKYYKYHIPDASIDDAILAYLDDRMLAPPDAIVSRWGSSRIYELNLAECGDHRHQVSEAWFQAGCTLPLLDAPPLVHCWTHASPSAVDLEVIQGTRLQLKRNADQSLILACHRERGTIASFGKTFSNQLLKPQWQDRQFLTLVDRVGQDAQPAPGQFDVPKLRLLVISAAVEQSLDAILDYANKAFYARRTKC